MAAATLQRARLERAEQELQALMLLVDGRHARDDTVTWATIRSGVEDCWRHIRAVLDSAPAGAEHSTPSPCQLRQMGRVELTQLAELADVLRLRLEAVRWAV